MDRQISLGCIQLAVVSDMSCSGSSVTTVNESWLNATRRKAKDESPICNARSSSPRCPKCAALGKPAIEKLVMFCQLAEQDRFKLSLIRQAVMAPINRHFRCRGTRFVLTRRAVIATTNRATIANPQMGSSAPRKLCPPKRGTSTLLTKTSPRITLLTELMACRRLRFEELITAPSTST